MLFSPFNNSFAPPIPQMDGMPNPLNSHNAIINSLLKLGNDDPKKKGNIAQSQAQIDAANDTAKRFASVHAKAIANDAYAARNIGDPLPQVIDQQTGQPYNGKYQQMPQSMIKPLPDWVTELKWDKQWGQPYYLDGNDIVYVDKKHFNSPKFLKTK